MKKNKIVLALDMDDTIADTNGFIYNWLINHYQESDRIDLAEEVEANALAGNTTLSLGEPHRTTVATKIMPSGRFMAHSGLTEITRKGLFSYLRDFIKKNDHLSITVVVCTHRGFHKKGEEYTEEWLRENTWYDPVSKIHCIDPAQHRDKVKYMTEMYPDHKVIILDDNPMGHLHEVIPEMKELIVYNQIADYPAYVNQVKCDSLDSFKVAFEKKVFCNG